jgi:polyhydroxyalkanoate synthase
MDLMASLAERDAIKTHLRVAGWTFEEIPLPHRLFEEVVDLLYREDRFTRGTLRVGNRIASPKAIEAPLLSIIDPRCRLVPPQAVLPFLRSTQSQDIKLLWYEGDTGVALQHVGMLVGHKAHTHLWPKAIRWMQTYRGP